MENVCIDDVKSLCGTAQSVSFKFYPNEDNIRMTVEFAKESHESLYTYPCGRLCATHVHWFFVACLVPKTNQCITTVNQMDTAL